MLREVLELFEVSESRADELFLMFLDEGENFADGVIREILSADITHKEKMFMSFALGVLSTVEKVEPPLMVKRRRKQYIH